MQNVTKSRIRGACPAPPKTVHTPRNCVAPAEIQAVQGFEHGDTRKNRWRQNVYYNSENPYGYEEMMWRRSVEKGRFNIRLDEEMADFCRRKAHAYRMSLSEFLRQMIVQGVIAENVREIEARLQHTVDEIRARAQPASAPMLPENVLLSLFTSEALLTEIVESRNPQKLYEAQDRAKRKLKWMTGQ